MDGESTRGSTGPARHMRLNHLPSLGGGGGTPRGKDLASTPAEKKAAAEAIEKHLEPDTRKAGTRARESTGAAAKEFGPHGGEGWLTGPALQSARKTWSEQLTTLMNRLGSEKAALRATNTLFQGTEAGVDLGIRRSSALDSY